ncbi:hypothetical protein DE146DRAFT_284574 [Phaeosphaeria sp. MPI-PUGE-AT-0046c]|nr:hypothetical protein DE146DRAFT_284574 [Phaeosphaeria sp. MPI-PUGE-AT-0046c]
MPPALSDDESSGDEQVAPQKQAKPRIEDEAVDGADEEDESEEDVEDEYVVEKIISHKFVKGALIFDVKWQGYDNPKDRTWEPEENMEGARDVMEEYFEELGGRPEQPGKGAQKRKGRQSGPKSESGTPASTKRVKQEKSWSPPPGSWEHDVDFIDTVEERLDPKTGQLAKYVYVNWKNDKKTQHPLQHIYTKCPQKMLQYYESHLVFTANGGLDDDMKDAY